mmetsp:Transcript_7495/g.29539  ORF Transcript_7495/g.29539 Transcript_7495/m.29539 type:complete len:201 (-) Transcript_7495:1365-1967(-)
MYSAYPSMASSTKDPTTRSPRVESPSSEVSGIGPCLRSRSSSSSSSSPSSPSSSPSSPSLTASAAALAASRSSRRTLAASFCRSSAPATRSSALKSPNAATVFSKSAPFPRSFFSSMPGASSRKSPMSALAAVATGLSLARLYCARSCSKSLCITSGHRTQISLTVLIPTATTSGLALSWTNWFTSCRSRGSSASGGTSS